MEAFITEPKYALTSFLPLLLQPQRLHRVKTCETNVASDNLTEPQLPSQIKLNQIKKSKFFRSQECAWRWMTSSTSRLFSSATAVFDPELLVGWVCHLHNIWRHPPLTDDGHRHPYNSQYTRSILSFFCPYKNLQTSKFYQKSAAHFIQKTIATESNTVTRV